MFAEKVDCSSMNLSPFEGLYFIFFIVWFINDRLDLQNVNKI